MISESEQSRILCCFPRSKDTKKVSSLLERTQIFATKGLSTWYRTTFKNSDLIYQARVDIAGDRYVAFIAGFDTVYTARELLTDGDDKKYNESKTRSYLGRPEFSRWKVNQAELPCIGLHPSDHQNKSMMVSLSDGHTLLYFDGQVDEVTCPSGQITPTDAKVPCPYGQVTYLDNTFPKFLMKYVIAVTNPQLTRTKIESFYEVWKSMKRRPKNTPRP